MGKKILAWLIGILLLIVGGFVFVSRVVSEEAPETRVSSEKPREVEVVRIGDLSDSRIPLSLIGRVESKNRATIRAEVAGEVREVFKELGDPVEAGEVILEIKNDGEVAALTQAEGALEAAEATLAKVKSGARSEQIAILETRLQNAEELLRQAKISGINAIRSAYAAGDDAIHSRVDQFYNNPRTDNLSLKFTPTDSQMKVDLLSGRRNLWVVFDSWEESLVGLGVEDDLLSHTDKARENLQDISFFLDIAAEGVNGLAENVELSLSTIDGWRLDVSAARTSVNNAITSLLVAKESINSRAASYDIALKEYEQALSGERDEDIRAAEASVKSAQGALAAARVRFEKTIIRSPINGTVNAIDVEQGDFLSSFQEAAKVSNNRALEVTTYITESDRISVSVGASARIEKKWDGVVTAIAPAIDETRKKIEVKVGIQDSEAELTTGQSVEVSIERAGENALGEIAIPISALKITAEATVVFTVEEEVLVAHPVVMGPIVGNTILIREGVDSDMEIVTDARGLREGDKVVMQGA